MWTGRATSCSNTLRRHIAATNRFVCTEEFLWKSLSLQQNFVAAINRKNCLIWFFAPCCYDKILLRRRRFSHTKKTLHTKRFVAATCRRDMLLQFRLRIVPHFPRASETQARVKITPRGKGETRQGERTVASQKSSPVWLSCRRQSYPVEWEHSLSLPFIYCSRAIFKFLWSNIETNFKSFHTISSGEFYLHSNLYIFYKF